MRGAKLLSVLAEEGRTAFGTAIHSADPALVEILALAGYDWVSIVVELASLTVPEISNLQRAADVHGLTTLVHLAGPDDARLVSMLDEGIGGVVTPGCERPEDVERIVNATRFPPAGNRGAAGGVRNAGFGSTPYAEYARHANADTVVGAIVETRAGMEAAAEIFAVPGLSLAYIGLLDLSQDLGVPGDFKHPSVRAAIECIVAAATAAGVPVGLSEYGFTAAELHAMGARAILSPSSEYPFIYKAFLERLTQARAAVGA
jgi:4-hydroxy-2-oxoheptanedioate aldolase